MNANRAYAVSWSAQRVFAPAQRLESVTPLDYCIVLP